MRAAYQRERAALAGSPGRQRVIRAQASIDRNAHMVGRVGGFRLESDEPAERGGTGLAPTPLQYLLFAVATWLLTQAARFAPLYQVDIQDAAADVRGGFSPAEKFGLEGPPGAFEEVTVTLEVRSPAPSQRVRQLVAHAERGCHSAQSLRATVPVHLRARLNGNDLEP
jgi:uncharacterized OsmC-like protein